MYKAFKLTRKFDSTCKSAEMRKLNYEMLQVFKVYNDICNQREVRQYL